MTKGNEKKRAGNKHRHMHKYTNMQHMIYLPKTIKPSKNKPVKIHNTTPVYLSAEATRNPKKKHPKTRSNNKVTHSENQSKKTNGKNNITILAQTKVTSEKKPREKNTHKVKMFANNK